MKKILFGLAVVFSALILAGCARGAYIAQVNSSLAGQVYSKEQVRKAIVDGGLRKGWVISKLDDNTLKGELNNRSHFVAVQIPYSEAGYQIVYQDSLNMSAKNNRIHKKYNEWVYGLDRSIRKSLITGN